MVRIQQRPRRLDADGVTVGRDQPEEGLDRDRGRILDNGAVDRLREPSQHRSLVIGDVRVGCDRSRLLGHDIGPLGVDLACFEELRRRRLFLRTPALVGVNEALVVDRIHTVCEQRLPIEDPRLAQFVPVAGRNLVTVGRDQVVFGQIVEDRIQLGGVDLRGIRLLEELDDRLDTLDGVGVTTLHLDRLDDGPLAGVDLVGRGPKRVQAGDDVGDVLWVGHERPLGHDIALVGRDVVADRLPARVVPQRRGPDQVRNHPVDAVALGAGMLEDRLDDVPGVEGTGRPVRQHDAFGSVPFDVEHVRLQSFGPIGEVVPVLGVAVDRDVFVAEGHPTDRAVLRLRFVHRHLQEPIPELEVGIELGVREVIRLRLLRDLLRVEAGRGVPTRRLHRRFTVTAVGSLEELDLLVRGLVELAHRDQIGAVPIGCGGLLRSHSLQANIGEQTHAVSGSRMNIMIGSYRSQ